MNIGPKTTEKMKVLAAAHIDTYAVKMNEAFERSDDGKLRVTLSFDISVSEKTNGGIDLDCTCGFTSERIKDKMSITVIENQADLPLDKVYKIKGE